MSSRADATQTLLFLDDDDQKIALVRQHSEALSPRLITVSSTHQAHTVLRSATVDAIVSSVHLQNESVFDFLRTTKQSTRSRGIPFILLGLKPSTLTESILESLQVSAQAFGADCFLVMKDFDPELLKENLNRCVEHSRKNCQSSGSTLTIFPFKRKESSHE